MTNLTLTNSHFTLMSQVTCNNSPNRNPNCYLLHDNFLKHVTCNMAIEATGGSASC